MLALVHLLILAAAIAQWQSIWLVIKRLLTPGSIPELAKRRRVLVKNNLR